MKTCFTQKRDHVQDKQVFKNAESSFYLLFVLAYDLRKNNAMRCSDTKSLLQLYMLLIHITTHIVNTDHF